LGYLAKDPLHNLLTAPTPDTVASLQELKLIDLCFGNASLNVMARALKHNTTLRTLFLDLTNSSAQGSISLFDMLRYNQSITTFQIWASYSENWKRHKCIVKLAQALVDNATVETLSVISHDYMHKAADSRHRIGYEEAVAFIQMLETNCSVTEIFLDGLHEDVSGNYDYITKHNDVENKFTDIMEFYTSLNGSGRRNILIQNSEALTRSDWVNLFHDASAMEETISLEAVYYFLRLNPSICRLD
jgi:hypothetical protein